jgi:hypothetical protein
MMKGVNSSMIYYKNFCKSHNGPPQHNSKKNEIFKCEELGKTRTHNWEKRVSFMNYVVTSGCPYAKE